MKKIINNVSACLISKNNEESIEKTLNSINNLFNEIIIIDTGSTDRTIEISKNYTDKIFKFKWENNFSSARNYAYNYVKNDWLFWIDTDEELIIYDKEKLEASINSDRENLFIKRFDFINNSIEGESLRCRFLRNLERNYFYGKIHEIPEKIKEDKTSILDIKIAIINHFPILKDKNKRNIFILENILNETKNEIEIIDYSIYLAKEYENILDKENLLINILDKIKNFTDIEIKKNNNFINFFNELILLYTNKKDYSNSLKYCDISLKYFPNNITTISMKAEIYFKLKDFNKSLYFYNSIIDLVNKDKYLKTIYIYESIKSYGTLYNIALCYKELQIFDKSIEYLILSLDINPNFRPSIDLLSKFMKNIQ